MSDQSATITDDLAAPRRPDRRNQPYKAYFGTPGNSIVTLLCLVILALIVKAALSWLLINAVFDGTPEDCKAASGACWPYLASKVRYMLFGIYPFDEQWRPLAATLLFIAAMAISVERYAFGRGEYKYFSYPLPDVVEQLRQSLYPHLAPIANRWHAAMRIEERFPAIHDEFRQVCHSAGQQRPTPLLLRYQANDYCCLHQDLYGEHVFPFQAIFLLNEPGHDFEGGELLLAESNPKKPGRVDVVPLRQGDAVVLAVNHRPVPSARGFYRANLRHGVSRLHSGRRHTLGIIFHDAK